MADNPIAPRTQDRPKRKVCPECGADMANLDPAGHALTHFPEWLPPHPGNENARKRQQQIREGGVEEGVE